MYQQFDKLKKEVLEQCFYVKTTERTRIYTFYEILKDLLYKTFTLEEKEKLILEFKQIREILKRYEGETYTYDLIEIPKDKFIMFPYFLKNIELLAPQIEDVIKHNYKNLPSNISGEVLFVKKIGRLSTHYLKLNVLIVDLNNDLTHNKNKKIDERSKDENNQYLIKEELDFLNSKLERLREDYVMAILYGFQSNMSQRMLEKEKENIAYALKKYNTFELNESNQLKITELINNLHETNQIIEDLLRVERR